MTGRILFVPPPAQWPHHCAPPQDAEFCTPALPDTNPVQPAPVGTVWQCGECQAVWVVRKGDRSSDGYDWWEPETRRERRRRERAEKATRLR